LIFAALRVAARQEFWGLGDSGFNSNKGKLSFAPNS